MADQLMTGKEWSTVEFKSKRPLQQIETLLVVGGTVELDAMNTVVTGVPVNVDTYITGTLQEKKLGLAGVLITLIALEPTPGGSNSFIARLSLAPTLGQTVLLGFNVYDPNF